jgi:BlaR1 peptidase M56
MEREYVLEALLALIGGATMLALGWWPPRQSSEVDGESRERTAWRQIWLPLLPTVLVMAWLCGWALAEPDPTDEILPSSWFLAALPFAALFLRSAIRAIRSLLQRPSHGAMTVGLLRPRVVVSPLLVSVLDKRAIGAAFEHERAHARHQDPLRVWLAQLATDLQWPWPEARKRFRSWMQALEIARDEEARARGADGADLVTAIIAAAKFQQQSRILVGAPLIGDASALRERVARLLEPLPSREREKTKRWSAPAVLAPAFLFLAVALGAIFGDTVLKALLWFAA